MQQTSSGNFVDPHVAVTLPEIMYMGSGAAASVLVHVAHSISTKRALRSCWCIISTRRALLQVHKRFDDEASGKMHVCKECEGCFCRSIHKLCTFTDPRAMSSPSHPECRVLVRCYRVQVRSPAGSNFANVLLCVSLRSCLRLHNLPVVAEHSAKQGPAAHSPCERLTCRIIM